MLPAQAGGATEPEAGPGPVRARRWHDPGRDSAPFHDALVRAATGPEVLAWLARSAGRCARLPLGELALAADVPCVADAGGFNRHTFLCGQSGSGKTYSLGVILEQLLTETDVRLVILDPNSDFVRLGQVRGGVDRPWPGVIRTRRAGLPSTPPTPPGEARLRLHAADIDPATQAAAIRLDPIEDREEYAALAEFLASGGQLRLETLAGSDRPEAGAASACGCATWASTASGCGRARSPVRSSTRSMIRMSGASSSTWARCRRGRSSTSWPRRCWATWRRRQERRPVLVVIDEAHNVCPAEPPDQLVAVAADHAIRIAAEGRKFGLYLLVSTQRPQKIAGNVLSQADNLVLMRLNSLADAAFTAAAFSFVPPSLIERSVIFRQGEALIAGRISPQPALLRFGARISEEGGADVPATWAAAR